MSKSSISEQEAHRLLDNLIQEIIDCFNRRDVQRMVDLHLPTAVVIVAGRKYSHGRKEIREVYESLMRKCDSIVFHPERGCVTTDGDYLISRGSVVMADREMHYESVFRRDVNGKYLICHDVFMLSGKSKL